MRRLAKHRFNFTVAAVLGLCNIFCHAQRLPNDIRFERVGIPGTIRSSQAEHIIQDKAGLIWVAGHGVYQYDGLKFKSYKDVSDLGESFNGQDVICLLYDSVQHRILIGTRRFGVLAYSYEDDRIVSLTQKKDQPIINQLAQTTDGRIWVASFNSGLFNLEKDSMIRVSNGETFLRPTTLLARGKTLFVGDMGKVVVVTHGTQEKTIPLSWNGKSISEKNHVSALYLDHQDRLWIGTEKNGVIVYNLKADRFEKYFPPEMSPFFSKITDINEDESGLIWMLTKGNGIAVYSGSEDKVLHLMKDPMSPHSLSSDNCFSILKDRQGVMWIGATGDLIKYDRDQHKFTHILHNPLEKTSLSDNMVRGVYEDHLGLLWIGTDGGFINIIDRTSGNVEQVRMKIRNDPSVYVPLYFQELNDQVMLIGTSAGLLQFDRRTRQFTTFSKIAAFTHNKAVRQILKRNNKLYFLYGAHLGIYDFNTGKIDTYKDAGGEEAIHITALHVDEQNRLWVGCNTGVALLEPNTGTFKFIKFKNIPPATDGAQLLVLSIEQIGNSLFVGTFNAGLWELDISDIDNIPTPRRYRADDGLNSETVYATLPDEYNNIWLSTNAGIVKWDRAARRFIPFSISEGLQEEEFNRLAYAKCANGELVFGGINGINIFDPADIHTDTATYAPQLLAATFHNPVTKTPKSTRADFSKPTFRVASDLNFLDVQFFVPYYKQPRRYTLHYKLENYDKNWIDATSSDAASYANLAPGTYTFKLKTRGINQDEKETSFTFSIAPPIWQTWWFIALTIVVIGFLLTTIIRSYLRKAQYDRERLEVLLKLRTAEIERSKEELQILNQKKDLIFSILSHDLRSPLTTLKGFLGYLINHAEELSTAELKRHAINIKNSVTNSLDLIDNTLFWSLSQMGNIQYSPSNFPLRVILDKLQGLYQLTADKKQIPFTVICPEDIMVCGDENMVYVTLRNLVSNALKFTAEGKPVSIVCKRWSDYAEIKVVDNGIGMSEDYVQKLMSMDQPMLKKGTSNEKGTGLGLLLCKKFVEMNKGELLISSKENQGTTFTLILPLAVHQPADQVLEK